MEIIFFVWDSHTMFIYMRSHSDDFNVFFTNFSSVFFCLGVSIPLRCPSLNHFNNYFQFPTFAPYSLQYFEIHSEIKNKEEEIVESSQKFHYGYPKMYAERDSHN